MPGAAVDTGRLLRDTYRVLTAVDAALMVIDAAKGVETQTRKLFEVCRRRGVPIFTFMNKCDRPTLKRLRLLDELESVLGPAIDPVIWPSAMVRHSAVFSTVATAGSPFRAGSRRQIPGSGHRHLAQRSRGAQPNWTTTRSMK